MAVDAQWMEIVAVMIVSVILLETIALQIKGVLDL
jgi:hypothetical protein